MGDVTEKVIGTAIQNKVGAESRCLTNRYRKYTVFMEGILSLKRISEKEKNIDVRIRQADLLFKDCRVHERVRQIKRTVLLAAPYSRLCNASNDLEIHEADIEKIQNRVWNLTMKLIYDLEPSKDNIDHYLDYITRAATELILLRREVTHSILLVRALGIETPNSLENIIRESEFSDIADKLYKVSEWRKQVDALRLEKHEILVDGLLRILSPENRKEILMDIYGPEPNEQEPGKTESGGEPVEDKNEQKTGEEYELPSYLAYKPGYVGNKKSRNGNGKKNGNGNGKEVRHVVEFSEETQKAIRDEGIDPEEIGNAIVYSFNLATPKKSIGKVHFKKAHFKKNLRRICPKDWKRAYNFIKKYDLIILHKGVTKNDVSFNLKPNNEVGQEIAKSVIAYMQTVS